ncbi:MAG: hypothetical protein V2B15_12745 [Bacteroidota bacterium]
MKIKLNSTGGIALIALRIVIGGHLFFNGLIKIISPNWTAKAFLEGSHGVFNWIASQKTMMGIVDALNMWTLLLAGLVLVLGIFEKLAAIAAILLLGLYYAAYPPFDILNQAAGTGPAFIANALLIEIVALVVLFVFPTGRVFGLGRLVSLIKPGANSSHKIDPDKQGQNRRREILKSLGTLPFLAAFSIPFFQSKTYAGVDAATGATSLGNQDVFAREMERLKRIDLNNDGEVQQNRSNLPEEKIGELSISRLIAGNSIISGQYGCRDLWYVNRLADNYNSENRILMTLKMMETYGINTIVLNFKNFMDYRLQDYWKEEWGGRMQWISEIYTYDINKVEHLVERNLMIGASAICISGEIADKCIANGDYDYIPRAIEMIKKFNVPAGIGACYNETIAFAIREKLFPDFIYKSFHKDSYWSAQPADHREYMEIYKDKSKKPDSFYDNFWCDKPEEFAELMKDTGIPWIAFKTSAAGAIPFQEGYEYAFENGASFVCSSLFDFQVGDCVRSLRRACYS